MRHATRVIGSDHAAIGELHAGRITAIAVAPYHSRGMSAFQQASRCRPSLPTVAAETITQSEESRIISSPTVHKQDASVLQRAQVSRVLRRSGQCAGVNPVSAFVRRYKELHSHVGSKAAHFAFCPRRSEPMPRGEPENGGFPAMVIADHSGLCPRPAIIVAEQHPNRAAIVIEAGCQPSARNLDNIADRLEQKRIPIFAVHPEGQPDGIR